MDKKDTEELLDFLKQQLKEKIKIYALTDVDYRSSTSLSIGRPNDKEIQGVQAKTGLNRKTLERQIGHIRLVIKEVEDGTYEILGT